jgi:hypothetical protein
MPDRRNHDCDNEAEGERNAHMGQGARLRIDHNRAAARSH